MKYLSLVLALLCISNVNAEEAEKACTAVKTAIEVEKVDIWTQDFEAAKKQAQKENKDILIDFTGSDWCGWCIKLDKEVFAQPEYLPAQEMFVHVKLDFPKDKSKLTKKIIAQNKKLQEVYKPPGYPTIYLCDSQGRPYATTGYLTGGPTNYISDLKIKQAVKTKFAKALAAAKKLKGAAAAQKISEVLEPLDLDMVLNFYQPELKIIKKNNQGKPTALEVKIDELRLAKQDEALLMEINQVFRSTNSFKANVCIIDKVLAKKFALKKSRDLGLFTKTYYLQTNKKYDDALVITTDLLTRPESFGENIDRLTSTHANLLIFTGKVKAGTKIYDTLIEKAKDPNQKAMYMATIAAALNETGDKKAAIKQYKKAIKTATDERYIKYFQGILAKLEAKE